MEHTQLLSVGIDIGTSTSQVIFSRLTIENTAGYFSIPAVSIIGKEVIYQSQVYPTPLVDGTLIDGEALAGIIAKEYAAAGISLERVETGAVIITGEAARKENAALVLEQMSCFSGNFVVSTAGPDLESVIAGQGSGAQKFSEETGTAVVNLDIGGGTTNVVLFDGGEVRGKGCLDIGGRQVTVDKRGHITYISPSAAQIAEANHLQLAVNEPASEEVLGKLCCGMSKVLEQLLGISEQTMLLEAVRTRSSACFQIPRDRPIRHICFSGGVADCIYEPDRETFCYGDIGVLLGKAIRESRLCQEFQVMAADQTIRATVIGAGSYTTEVSGSTISYSEGVFPLKNIPVLKLLPQEEEWCWKSGTEALIRKVKWFLEQNDAPQMVLAISGRHDPAYQALKNLAKTVTYALHQTLPDKAPLLLIVQEDMAKALGQMIRKELAGVRPVAVVDEIHVEQNYYVDFGHPVMDGLVIPVVVKTLIFG